MLEPVLGTYLAPVLFAIALIASGQSSTLTGTVSGQVVMEGYLNLRIEPWLRRLITRLLAVIPAFITIAVAGEDKSGSLLILSQVILSLQLGFAVIPLAHWTSSKRIMGNFRINVPARIVSWIAVGTIVTLNVKLVIETLIGLVASARNPLVLYFLVIPLVAATFLLLLYTILEPVVKFRIPLKLVPAHHQPEELKLDKPPAFRRIAITLDFTESDNRAVSYAVTQGGRQAEYFLIHVVESAGARMIQSDISDRETADDKSFLDNYTSQLTARDYR
jgi:manganese transport protein